MKKISTILVAIFALIFIGFFAYPIIYNLLIPPPGLYGGGISKLKQLSTSALLYKMDYDGVFPGTSAMPGTRAVLIPYAKNEQPFERVHGHHSRPQYNFNLAGVKESLPPYPGTVQQSADQVGVFYCLNLTSPGNFVIRVDGSVEAYKNVQAEVVQKMLSHQFDRQGARLFPPDYLENKDPLK